MQIMEVNQRDRNWDFIEDMVDAAIPKKTKEIIIISNFIIWRERCNRIFNDKIKTEEQLIQDILQQWKISQAPRDEGRRFRDTG